MELFPFPLVFFFPPNRESGHGLTFELGQILFVHAPREGGSTVLLEVPLSGHVTLAEVTVTVRVGVIPDRVGGLPAALEVAMAVPRAAVRAAHNPRGGRGHVVRGRGRPAHVGGRGRRARVVRLPDDGRGRRGGHGRLAVGLHGPRLAGLGARGRGPRVGGGGGGGLGGGGVLGVVGVRLPVLAGVGLGLESQPIPIVDAGRVSHPSPLP